jgi:hypothetical protein
VSWSIVCDDVVAIVMIPVPEFFMIYSLPVIHTAVGKVTVNVLAVHSITQSVQSKVLNAVIALYALAKEPPE